MLVCDLYPYILLGFVAISSLSIAFNVLQKKTISKLKESSETLIKDAYFNHVTALPNENNLEIVLKEQIDRSARHDKTFLFMFIKLKHYQNDADIIDAGNKLSECIRNEDFLGHIGNEKFVILFNEYLEANNYELIIKRVINAFPKYAIKIGISNYPDDGTDKKYLLQKAMDDSRKSLY